MKDEYVIISKIAIQKRIEELENRRDSDKCSDPRDFSYLTGKILALEQILSQSTPLIPEIKNAFNKGERYGWDTQKTIGNLDEIKQKISFQSLDNYIANLKLDI